MARENCMTECLTEQEIEELRKKLRSKRYIKKALNVTAAKIAEIIVPKRESKNERADKAKA